MAKEIPLSKGKFAIVDDEDYERLVKYKWKFNSNGYAARSAWNGERYESRQMHREILSVPDGMYVDHINRNKLDNRKENLRIASRTENNMNTPPRSHNTSGFKGVSYMKNKGKWRATINKHGEHIHIGVYDNPIEAAKAYNEKAIELFGEFAWLNPIPDESEGSDTAA